MELQFTADTHKYENPKDPTKKWISVTKVISLFKPPFDRETVAKKCSKNKKSKWHGMTPEEIIKTWDSETERALSLGSWYHDQREEELIACDTIRRNGIDLPIFRPIAQDGIKISPNQALVPGIYPEHMVYLKSAKICGQADRVEVVGDKVDIYDYKTNKEIKTEGYTNWEGITKKLLGPVSHMDDCNLMHYGLQLSIYMYIILKHNHSLKPGKLQIHHIVFEVEDRDVNGYPIVATDAMGEPIVKKVVPYEYTIYEERSEYYYKVSKKHIQNYLQMIKLLEIENKTVKPTEHCQTIKWLRVIQEKYPDNMLKIYAYIFYMACPSEDNPYFNLPGDIKEDAIVEDLEIDFSLEEEEIIEAIEKATKLYETPTLRAYTGIKTALDNIAEYMANTTITDGKDGNIAQIRAVAKDFDAIRQSYKGISKDLEAEQESHVRGGQNLGYDQL